MRPKYLYSDKFNHDEFDGFHIEYIYPKDDKTRLAFEHSVRLREMFDNDLFDEDVAFDQELANLRKNDPKLDEAYRKFEFDYKNDNSAAK